MVKPKTDNKLKDKVAAIFGHNSSENKIKEDIRKQREEEMQLLANRFNKQKEIFAQSQQQQSQGSSKDHEHRELPQQSHVKAAAASLMNAANSSGGTSSRSQALPLPPPPPMPTPTNAASGGASQTTKRRSRKCSRFLVQKFRLKSIKIN